MRNSRNGLKHREVTAKGKRIEDKEDISLEPGSESASPQSTDTVIRPKKVRRSVKLGCGGIQQLPDELLLEILCRVPPEELKVCKRVCRSWSRLLDHERYNRSFVNSNLLHSAPSVLFLDMPGILHTSNIQIAKLWRTDRPRRRCSSSSSSRFQFHMLNFNWLREKISANKYYGDYFHGRVCATSSDGALLIMFFDGDSYLVNPLTRQLVELPHFKHPPKRMPSLRYCAIARIHDAGKFKVLTVGEDVDGSVSAWYMLTVGTNMSWEVVSNLPFDCIPSIFRTPLESGSISIGGNIYVPFATNDKDNFTFAAFDVSNETAYSVEIPPKIKAKQQISSCGRKWKLLQMDEHLGCVEYNSIDVLEIWILEDFRRSEWTLMLSIDISFSSGLEHFSFISPYIWLQSDQVLVMYAERRFRIEYLAYFVRTKTFQSLKGVADRRPFLHRYSLVPLF